MKQPHPVSDDCDSLPVALSEVGSPVPLGTVPTTSPRLSVSPASALSPAEYGSWRAIQRQESRWDSAFFHPEFTRVVQAVRGDVEVAVIRQQERPVGFFPFQRGPVNVAQPVVGRLSEFHGVVIAKEQTWDAAKLLRECGLTAWYFDHVEASQTEFARFSWASDVSPYIDISQGYEQYRATIRQTGSAAVSQMERKARKMQREVGPLTFRYHDNDKAVLKQLIDWKWDQHRRTGRLEIFRHAWVNELLDTIRTTDREGFSGPLSALYAGNELVAAHLGLRADHVLHWWFPAYNRNFDRYSPGLILMLRLLEECSSLGVSRLDLGKGTERYKSQFKTADRPLLIGGIDQRLWINWLRARWHGTKRILRASPCRNHFAKFMEISNHLREQRLFGRS